MSTTRKQELVDRVAADTQITQIRAKAIINSFLDEIIAELVKGNRLEFRDFGVFEIVTRAAREAQNPKTLERIHVPARRAVKFKAGRLMKKKLTARKARA
jgi:integration host factor subunit beta